MLRRIFLMILLVTAFSLLFSDYAITAENVTIAIVCELTGAGATVGKNWDRGINMAVGEINAAGGILGRKIETFALDTKTEAPVSVAAMKKAVERKPFVVMGTIFSGSTIVNMPILQEAGIPQFTGSAAPPITQKGNPNIFRTCYSTDISMFKVVKWLTEVLKVKNLAIIYVNDTFGKGGRDALVKLLEPRGVRIVADITTEAGQSDFTGEIARVKASGADTAFLFVHEEECGRLLPQAKEMGLERLMRLIGHVTVLTGDTIKLAREAANGIQGYVELSPLAPPLKSTAGRYEKQYQEVADHNFFQGYMGTYIVKAVIEEIGVFDQQKFRDYLHNRTLCVKDHPKILMDIHFDEKGDIDRESFIGEIKEQKQVITGTLDPLHPEWFEKCKK